MKILFMGSLFVFLSTDSFALKLCYTGNFNKNHNNKNYTHNTYTREDQEMKKAIAASFQSEKERKERDDAIKAVKDFERKEREKNILNDGLNLSQKQREEQKRMFEKFAQENEKRNRKKNLELNHNLGLSAKELEVQKRALELIEKNYQKKQRAEPRDNNLGLNAKELEAQKKRYEELAKPIKKNNLLNRRETGSYISDTGQKITAYYTSGLENNCFFYSLPKQVLELIGKTPEQARKNVSNYFKMNYRALGLNLRSIKEFEGGAQTEFDYLPLIAKHYGFRLNTYTSTHKAPVFNGDINQLKEKFEIIPALHNKTRELDQKGMSPQLWGDMINIIEHNIKDPKIREELKRFVNKNSIFQKQAHKRELNGECRGPTATIFWSGDIAGRYGGHYEMATVE